MSNVGNTIDLIYKIINQEKAIVDAKATTKIQTVLENNFQLTQRDSKYQRIMKEAQDIMDSNGMLQQRNRHSNDSFGSFLSSTEFIVGGTVLALGGLCLWAFQGKASKPRVEEQPLNNKTDANVKDKPSKHEFFKLSK